MSINDTRFYIDGRWISPITPSFRDVIDPATEEVVGQASMGSDADVELAVAAARRAWPVYATTSIEDRIALIEQILAGCHERADDLARTVSLEMGSPLTYSHAVQVNRMIYNAEAMIPVLRSYTFEQVLDGSLVCREPIGVCGLISPWNWPLSAFASKVVAALAAGCTSIYKPSEFSPLSSIVMAEIFHDAGVPEGVFNLINGEGTTVGHAMSSHPGIDMISFTGSMRAGVLVGKAAAGTVKRVVQELGGKSANIILSDANLEESVPAGLLRCFTNTGQSCQAPSRMLVQHSQLNATISLAKRTAEAIRVGDPFNPQTEMGPLANKAQFDRVQGMIEKGIQEGAILVTGGLGRPDGINRGYFVRPTVFANVTPSMTIAKEEIFGPVLSIMTYDTDDEAVEIANGTPYGLAGYVQSANLERGRAIAKRLQAGRIYVNSNRPIERPGDRTAPFGGYKQSGNGRQQGIFGLEEFLEIKAILGCQTT